jgi:hypothetical protein
MAAAATLDRVEPDSLDPIDPEVSSTKSDAGRGQRTPFRVRADRPHTRADDRLAAGVGPEPRSEVGGRLLLRGTAP